MNLTTLATKNAARNGVRTALTVFGVATAIFTFVLLRTLVWSWTASSRQGASDRVGIRNKVTFVMTLPKKYVDEVRANPGVTAASYGNWFGGKDPLNSHAFFASIAVEPDDFLRVYDEVKLSPGVAEAWRENRRGAIVGDALAHKMGWKVGDRITLRGTIYPGDWHFDIVGIYTTTRTSADRSTFYFQWKYLNESIPLRRREQIGWVVARIADAGRSAAVCRELDSHFEERDVQSLCMSERAMQASFLGMMSAVLRALDFISFVILAIMTLILGNTIAMGVRERTKEYGTLRAIGFLPRQIVLFIALESLVTGALGGVLGLSIAYPFVDRGIGRFLEENMGSLFPVFRVQPHIAVAALGAACLLAAIAAMVPAYKISKLVAVDALRQVG